MRLLLCNDSVSPCSVTTTRRRQTADTAPAATTTPLLVEPSSIFRVRCRATTRLWCASRATVPTTARAYFIFYYYCRTRADVIRYYPSTWRGRFPRRQDGTTVSPVVDKNSRVVTNARPRGGRLWDFRKVWGWVSHLIFIIQHIVLNVIKIITMSTTIMSDILCLSSVCNERLQQIRVSITRDQYPMIHRIS